MKQELTTNKIELFTSGEWEVDKKSGDLQFPIIIKSGKKELACIQWGINRLTPETYEEIEANAALMASGPTLLQTLKDVYNYVITDRRPLDLFDFEYLKEKIEKAISKTNP